MMLYVYTVFERGRYLLRLSLNSKIPSAVKQWIFRE